MGKSESACFDQIKNELFFRKPASFKCLQVFYLAAESFRVCITVMQKKEMHLFRSQVHFLTLLCFF
jgi:hypothetical protein